MERHIGSKFVSSEKFVMIQHMDVSHNSCQATRTRNLKMCKHVV